MKRETKNQCGKALSYLRVSSMNELWTSNPWKPFIQWCRDIVEGNLDNSFCILVVFNRFQYINTPLWNNLSDLDTRNIWELPHYISSYQQKALLIFIIRRNTLLVGLRFKTSLTRLPHSESTSSNPSLRLKYYHSCSFYKQLNQNNIR